MTIQPIGNHPSTSANISSSVLRVIGDILADFDGTLVVSLEGYYIDLGRGFNIGSSPQNASFSFQSIDDIGTIQIGN